MLEDPAAADDLILLIEDGGLAWGDGALGFVENGMRGGGPVVGDRARGQGGWLGLMTMAYLGEDADRPGEGWDGDPIEAVGAKFPGEEFRG